MLDKPLHILLVEDSAADADILGEMLREVFPTGVAVTHVESIADAVECSRNTPTDLVLLDLSLPDSFGLSTVVRACREMGEAPIVVLTGMESPATGVRAIEAGAQDYLIKGRIDHDLLGRTLRFAVVRHSKQEDLRTTSLMDELTGLYNRRGFFTLMEQYRQSEETAASPFLILFADLDGLKQINDTLGHQEGDCALKEAAAVLKKTFRSTDLLARYGGDEFLVAVLDANLDSFEIFQSRLERNLLARNSGADRRYQLQISLGAVQYDPKEERSLEELIHAADVEMYKRKHRTVSPGPTTFAHLA
jgi:diguanylate cyclase (GGDEF)-like protein